MVVSVIWKSARPVFCHSDVLSVPVVSAGSVAVLPSRLRFVFALVGAVPGGFDPCVFSAAVEAADSEVRETSVFNHFLAE